MNRLQYGLRAAVCDSMLVVIRHLLELVEDPLKAGRVRVLVLALFAFLLLADVTAADVQAVPLAEEFEDFFVDFLDGVSGFVAGLADPVEDNHSLVTFMAREVVLWYGEM